MKPDIRPIEILTRVILDTSPAWMILDGVGRGYHLRTALIRIHPNDITFRLNSSDGTWFDKSDTCYPCKPYAPFEPLPWPVVEGEEQIKEWRGLSCKFDAQVTSNWGHSYWALFTRMNDETAYETELRPGFHPAPRRQINPDGTETSVWVWEKDT